MHRTITTRRVITAIKRSHEGLSSPGFCTACGLAQRGIEPDAEDRECTGCHEPAVRGAEQLLIALLD